MQDFTLSFSATNLQKRSCSSTNRKEISVRPPCCLRAHQSTSIGSVSGNLYHTVRSPAIKTSARRGRRNRKKTQRRLPSPANNTTAREATTTRQCAAKKSQELELSCLRRDTRARLSLPAGGRGSLGIASGRRPPPSDFIDRFGRRTRSRASNPVTPDQAVGSEPFKPIQRRLSD